MTKRSLGIMLVFGLVAGVLAALPARAATAVPATPNIVDPLNDANFLNDQGFGGTSVSGGGQTVVVPDTGDHQTPEDNASASDILKVWFSHTADEVSAHMLVQNPPPKASSIRYQVWTSPGEGSVAASAVGCIRFVGMVGGKANGLNTTYQGPDFAKILDACNEGTNVYTTGVEAKLLVETLDDGTGIVSITGPRSYSPFLGAGQTLTKPSAATFVLVGFAGVPQAGSGASAPLIIDDTKVGLDYSLAESSVEPPPAPEPPGKEDPPGKGKKKGCKKGKGKKKGACPEPEPQPEPAKCATYVPGDKGKDAETSVVTDEATAEKPIELTLATHEGVGSGRPGDNTGALTSEAFHNVQVDSTAASAGLWISVEFTEVWDYDLYLDRADGTNVASSGGFANQDDLDASDSDTQLGSETLTGIGTADCGGYTIDVAGATTAGEDVTLKLWLGETRFTPGGAALYDAALSLI